MVLETVANGAPLDETWTATDEMVEIEIEMTSHEDGQMVKTPASTTWLATMHGRDMTFGKLKSQDEWIYFKQNVVRFQCRTGQSEETDNYLGIMFGAFANQWNE